MLPIESECVQRAIFRSMPDQWRDRGLVASRPVPSAFVAELTALVNVGGARLVPVAASRREPVGGALFPASG
jgi:hypothetical protein